MCSSAHQALEPLGVGSLWESAHLDYPGQVASDKPFKEISRNRVSGSLKGGLHQD